MSGEQAVWRPSNDRYRRASASYLDPETEAKAQVMASQAHPAWDRFRVQNSASRTASRMCSTPKRHQGRVSTPVRLPRTR